MNSYQISRLLRIVIPALAIAATCGFVWIGLSNSESPLGTTEIETAVNPNQQVPKYFLPTTLPDKQSLKRSARAVIALSVDLTPATAECRLDRSKAWNACTAMLKRKNGNWIHANLSGLKPGKHRLDYRAKTIDGQLVRGSYKWRVSK